MKIEIFGAPACTYCDQAKQLAEVLATSAEHVEYSYYDLMDQENMIELKKRLDFTPRSIPQIYVDGTHIGGFQEFRNTVNAAAMKMGGTL